MSGRFPAIQSTFVPDGGQPVVSEAPGGLRRRRGAWVVARYLSPSISPESRCGAMMADYFAHESSYVDDGATIGAGSKVWHFSHVMPGAVIGERCNLGQNVVVMPGTRIGNNVKIQNNVSIYEGVELEDDVFCGPSCVFTNVINPRSHVSRKHEYRRTLVRRGSSIGANATIVCGTTLGEFSFIGAGAVVTSDVLPYALMVGVPARRVGWVCQCGTRLTIRDGAGTCADCGATYREADGRLEPVGGPTAHG